MQTALAIVLSFLIAFISFKYVELPFRCKDSHISRRRVFSLGAIATALCAMIAFVRYAHQGFPGRYDTHVQTLVSQNTGRKNDYQEVCSNWRKEYNSMADIELCQINPDAPKKIMFIGDSHMQQLYPLLQAMDEGGKLRGHGTVFAISAGCVPAESINRTRRGFHCDAFNHFVNLRAAEEDIDTVFIGFSAGWVATPGEICHSINGSCTKIAPRQETNEFFYHELADHIKTLQAMGKHVIVSLPFPIYAQSIPNLAIHNAVFRRFGANISPFEINVSSIRDQLTAIATQSGAAIFDPRTSLCPAGQCITQIDGVSIYRDNSHLVASQVGILEENMTKTLKISND